MPASSRTVYFATSNKGKEIEARLILAPFGIRVRPFPGKGIEIQAESDEVAAYSAREGARKYGRPLIVEDAGLHVDELNGFPGPYSSYVFKTIGIAGLLRLMKGADSMRASFKSAVAYCEPAGEPKVFQGRVSGMIVRRPLGENGFGFDPVFLPDGSKETMGQLTVEQKCVISHRGEAMRRFAEWFVRT